MLPRYRLASLTSIVLGAVLLVAGCGAGLGKENFARTTIPAASGDGVSTGEITDKAVSADALRAIDTCKLIDKTALADLGTASEPRMSDPSDCRNDVKDVGGKKIDISIELGTAILQASNPQGVVAGLPQVLRPGKDGAPECALGAVTSKQLGIGISVNVTYQGGDACKTATALMEKVVKRLRDANPPKYTVAKGSLLTADPCASVDDAVIKELAPAGNKVVVDLHHCTWSGSGQRLTVEYDSDGMAPSEGKGYVKADIPGVTAFQKPETGSAKCTVKWTQLPLEGDRVELVAVGFQNDHGKDPITDGSCAKAVKAAKTVVPKLPKP
ncbi:DUF3558 domain-containing protein [Amycolatopsis sp. cg5]|uniref:DUF3558 domain-containing protein n=1 Tax=Amycolatopsis sp. cg5 TaxID=3238802 RepID=UPI0035269812